jgi:hypothetical protein
MNELEALKHGDLVSRFRYLYVTKLKKYRFMRRLRDFYGTDLAESLFLVVAFIPVMVFLLVMWPFMYWQAMRDQKEYSKLYENREHGWGPPT